MVNKVESPEGNRPDVASLSREREAIPQYGLEGGCTCRTCYAEYQIWLDRVMHRALFASAKVIKE